MKLDTAADDYDPHGLDQHDRALAIGDAIIEMALENPSFAKRLEKFLDRVIVIAEDRELLGLPRGCFPTRARYYERLEQARESNQRELERLNREIESLERELKILQA